MTAADKLRELLASRPAMPNTEELVRWWRHGGAAVQELLDGFPAAGRAIGAIQRDRMDLSDEIAKLRSDLQATDHDLVAARAALRREQDARAELRVELDRVKAARDQACAMILNSDATISECEHARRLLEVGKGPARG